ncbi:MAG: hypothetical protein IEMM0006_1458 [bacterium]|nr:MAG: hypothetical protein IEMM0006_1458 [bacterium]
MKQPRIHIALPVLNESLQLPRFLQSLGGQKFLHFDMVACVNQYNDWWLDTTKRVQCEDNRKSFALLRQPQRFPVTILDKSLPGKGWQPKKGGVGRARKTIMDTIAADANDSDIIVSMDADTDYPPDYLAVIAEYFLKHPSHLGLTLPYYHVQTQNEENNRLMIRYEMYMRYHALNMIRIGNPYCFTALGSAMAFPVWAYRRVGGLTPVLSGEDFYFLQKLVKSGVIGYFTSTTAYPSSRFSDRVNFGTGPALIKGRSGNWDSYPFFPSGLFDLVAETFHLFPLLFDHNVSTPMDDFLKETFKTANVWGPLRDNYKDRRNFVRACISKVDGLRILQFLKRNYSGDGKNLLPLTAFIREHSPFPVSDADLAALQEKGFEKAGLKMLFRLRETFFLWESRVRTGKDISQ